MKGILSTQEQRIASVTLRDTESDGSKGASVILLSLF